MNELPQLLESDRLREKVDALDLLSTSDLDSEAEWQRAYSLLSFMTHGYIWGGQSPSEVRIALEECENPFLSVIRILCSSDTPPEAASCTRHSVYGNLEEV